MPVFRALTDLWEIPLKVHEVLQKSEHMGIDFDRLLLNNSPRLLGDALAPASFELVLHDLMKMCDCDYCGLYCDLRLRYYEWCYESTCLNIKDNTENYNSLYISQLKAYKHDTKNPKPEVYSTVFVSF